jgi:hypothetical protein
MAHAMLVSPFSDATFARHPKWLASEKFDGWRCGFKAGEFFTRKGNACAVDAALGAAATRVSDAVRHLTSDSMWLDGELWLARDKQHSDVNTALSVGSEDISFKVFDFYDAEHPSVTFEERYALLLRAFAAAGTPRVSLVEQVEVSSRSQADAMFKAVLDGSGEGIVLRLPSQLYLAGARPAEVMKMKPWDTDAAIVVGHSVTKKADAAGHPDGYVSSLRCRLIDTETDEPRMRGPEFGVQFKRAGAPPVGSRVTVKYRSNGPIPQSAQLVALEPAARAARAKRERPIVIDLVDDDDEPLMSKQCVEAEDEPFEPCVVCFRSWGEILEIGDVMCAPCGHSVCSLCLSEIELRHQGVVNCPTCRAPNQWTRNLMLHQILAGRYPEQARRGEQARAARAAIGKAAKAAKAAKGKQPQQPAAAHRSQGMTSTDLTVLTTREWQAIGGSDLAVGQTVGVTSDSTPSTQYLVKLCQDGAVSCTCPAWKFQKNTPPVARKCKHTEAVRGAAAEKRRLLG